MHDVDAVDTLSLQLLRSLGNVRPGHRVDFDDEDSRTVRQRRRERVKLLGGGRGVPHGRDDRRVRLGGGEGLEEVKTETAREAREPFSSTRARAVRFRAGRGTNPRPAPVMRIVVMVEERERAER